jgi:hypothetical protein
MTTHTAPQPGIHANLPAPFYHADPGASASRLKRIAMHSPLHCKLDMDNPTEPTPTMILGTLVHQAILEPNEPMPQVAIVPESFVVPPNYVPKTRKDVQPGDVVEWSFRRKFCQQWRDDQKAAGRIVVTQPDMDFVSMAAQAVKNHPVAGPLFDGADTEVSMFWNSKDGFRCKARLDMVPSGTCLVDIKKTNNAKPSVFARHAINMGYHIQMAWYRLAWSILGDGERTDCILVAVEDDTADVTVHKLSEQALQEGERLALAAFDRWKECHKTGRWPGYSEELGIIDLPAWHKTTELEDL